MENDNNDYKQLKEVEEHHMHTCLLVYILFVYNIYTHLFKTICACATRCGKTNLS